VGEAETFPSAPPAEGWVTHLRGARVGVWLMPDNVNAGALEAFLLGLVPPSPLFDHAEKAVSEAITHGARFAEVHREKARLHTYVAWSKEPGRPYGRAIAAGDFDVTRSDLPARFAAWWSDSSGRERAILRA
jgi:hypothetical protein